MSTLRRLISRRGTTTNGYGDGGTPRPSTSDSDHDEPVDAPDARENSAISSSDYARRRRELMALYRDLRALGFMPVRHVAVSLTFPCRANAFLDVPNITVIGGQSAGKSSLVEAVSGINVPRDSGTCTRCPMECTMSGESDSWSCQISLRFDYKQDGSKYATPETHAFGSILTDKTAVELWLRRAQAAILHPHIQYQNFYTKTEDQLKNPPADDRRLSFSKNAVLVELRDSTLTDLGFVDLPGLIQNDAPEAIRVVRDLTVSRINARKTLILVTIPMSGKFFPHSFYDLQNQEAARLAKEADRDGVRTIAVLTKPDLLGPGATGSRQTWTDVLEGRRFELKHGYYCVRLPDDAERAQAITKTESERRATEYFNSTQPWRDITDRSRFGVPNLSACLSRLLVSHMEDSLPGLRRQVTGLLEKCSDDLNRLPSPPVSDSEPAAAVLLMVTEFCRAFRAAVFGDTEDHKAFVQTNRQHYARFQADIKSTVPDFRPFSGHVNYRNPNLDVVETRDGVEPVGPLDLVDVRQVITGSITWELPSHVPFDAMKSLVSRFTGQWRNPSLACFQAVVKSASDFLSDTLMDKYFAQFTQLKDYIRELTCAELDRCRVEALKTLEKMLTETHAWLGRYNSVHRHSGHYLPSVFGSPGRPRSPSPSPVRYIEIEGVAFSDELHLMAKTRAYWQIAYQRIIDYVPLLIEHEFNQRMAERLQPMLFEQLLSGSDVGVKMQELMAEDPVVCAQRRSLKMQIERLSEIKQKLDGLT
ncbi:P-loop containing nucleoside triphosphate hydrolase protein [Roridomyces roridus]|uniref:P-loop containing nucleoside triphosphate hydrolase protein n=1 Tax=Roridomyces roridus TaxID=1738132 RepID=A0AAD7F8Y6_9AGAR|nr:P-loop containing nucleoside triphosphate hydrolase protein [Roridomyces roridus]